MWKGIWQSFLAPTRSCFVSTRIRFSPFGSEEQPNVIHGIARRMSNWERIQCAGRLEMHAMHRSGLVG